MHRLAIVAFAASTARLRFDAKLYIHKYQYSLRKFIIFCTTIEAEHQIVFEDVRTATFQRWYIDDITF